MGAGMAKFIARRFVNRVETIDDYDEYCHYVAGLVRSGLLKLFHASGKEDMAPEDLSNSMGVFLQDLKYDENSVKAVECLNDMVTNALANVEDCFKYMSVLRDPAFFRFYWMGNLLNLVVFYIDSNSLTGPISLSLGNLRNLEVLYVSLNQLSGSIPQELGNLESLIDISLYSNNLSGSIPMSLSGFRNLLYLDLYNNSLPGTIP
ncbi:squalene synthase 2-like [Pistacia vera]|uniref:squalene synthase 2-like n=1 Tax=Pistacia vera TaxID=55513 RepID=UPI0012634C2E|nr:squalene synthase 2-like [Pistacia vera]